MAWSDDNPTRVQNLGPFSGLNTAPVEVDIAAAYQALAQDPRFASVPSAAGERRFYFGGITTASVVRVVRLDQGTADNPPDASTQGGRYYAGVDYPYQMLGRNKVVALWADDDATEIYINLCL